MTPWFTATEQFSPSAKPADWQAYVAGAGLPQLDEVVTLDVMLCPPVLKDIKDEYWPHIVNEDFMLQFFVNLDYMLQEVAALHPKNVLCVYRNPSVPPSVPSSDVWEFVGYDLVDTSGSNSALTNCGGFPKAFSAGELSSKGLLTQFARAMEVQASLRAEYPDEAHAHCHVWAIFRASAA